MGERPQLDERSPDLAPQDRNAGRGLPALDIQHKLVFFTLLSTSPSARAPGNGAVVALSMKTGKVTWSHPLPPGSESSPLVHGLKRVPR